jgi:hypothetical protein
MGGRSRYNRSSAARFAQARMRGVASGASLIRDLQTTRWRRRAKASQLSVDREC